MKVTRFYLLKNFFTQLQQLIENLHKLLLQFFLTNSPCQWKSCMSLLNVTLLLKPAG